MLTRAESLIEPPNYYIRALGNAGARRPVTAFNDPQEFFRGVQRQFITYTRKDGVKLSATLYLPPGYTKGERLPVVMWAYPREFTDADTASQVVGSPHRFTLVTRQLAHVPAALRLRGPRRADHADRRARRDGQRHLHRAARRQRRSGDRQGVEMGVADRDRIGVGGHSYGAFMTANLLAHSRPLPGRHRRERRLQPHADAVRLPERAADLLGGARSSTAKMSPFYYARQDQGADAADARRERRQLRHVPDPVRALLHGARRATAPPCVMSRCRTKRTATPRARLHLHVLAEKIAWFDKYVKNAGPKTTTEQRH